MPLTSPLTSPSTMSSIDDLLGAHRAGSLLMSIDLEVRREVFEGLEPEVLSAIAAGLAGSIEPESVSFEGIASRRYVRLLQTARYDAWLIAWAPAADLELHDHGGSSGAFHVVRGELIEAHTDLTTLRPLESISLTAGETRQVNRTRVHRVWNPGPANAVSVHVYSPPLTSMNFYDDCPGSYLELLRTEPVRSGSPEAGVSI